MPRSGRSRERSPVDAQQLAALNREGLHLLQQLKEVSDDHMTFLHRLDHRVKLLYRAMGMELPGARQDRKRRQRKREGKD